MISNNVLKVNVQYVTNMNERSKPYNKETAVQTDMMTERIARYITAINTVIK
jgi:hypothetical protein